MNSHAPGLYNSVKVDVTTFLEQLQVHFYFGSMLLCSKNKCGPFFMISKIKETLEHAELISKLLVHIS